MCDVITLAAGAVAVSAAGTVASYAQQSDAANKQKTYNRQVSLQQNDYRLQVLDYQNKVWQQDIDYARDMLSWSEEEWNRQVRYDVKARQAVEKNTLAAVGQVMLRQVEEDMAVVAQGVDTRTRGAQARAQLSVRDRGVEGNSVDAIVNDVTRQEGEVLNVMAMNRASSLRQLNREAIAIDAQGDQQLASIQLKTYAPSTQIREPSPVNPVAPAAPVAGPNVGQLITGLSGAVASGFTNYSSWTGQTMQQTLNQTGNWLSRQFTIS
ncbi:MAG TPA: hypothetical protein VNR89_04075 [Roseomonas sp.]|nr:hypothetical protein [Roseomonas sp.]